ncbi:PREDICTED: polycomb group protein VERNALIZATION 2-like [Camelina sativa]|uniref:Polycomb group protein VERNALIZATION 2-like n=1 Tax=Camelina sativa TaxID=90675 RepID=A0ABM1QPR9_CAMSA|nr:PREDICTED: polycomb group protein VERNALIZATION 2-like [Camelina sativa]
MDPLTVTTEVELVPATVTVTTETSAVPATVTVTTEVGVVPATVTVTTEAKVVSAKRLKTTRHLPLPRRQFYHSQSGQPMTLDEVLSDRDSDNEVENVAEAEAETPDLMIDDSMKENEIMEIFIQLWNSFVKKNRVLADAHIPWACEEFSKLYRKELHDNFKLDMCWRLFMMKQWDYGILDATTITKCNTIIQKYSATSYIDVEENYHKSNKK